MDLSKKILPNENNQASQPGLFPPVTSDEVSDCNDYTDDYVNTNAGGKNETGISPFKLHKSKTSFGMQPGAFSNRSSRKQPHSDTSRLGFNRSRTMFNLTKK